MFLVCRSWYHCVERYLCLADTYYNLPEAYRDPSPQHSSDVHKWCNGSQLWKFKQERDERWNSVQVVRLEATTRCLDFLPDSIEDLFLKTSTKIQTTRIIDIEALTSFTSLKKVSLRGCQKISFRGLELIQALEELDLSESGVSGVGFLRSCQHLRVLNAQRCAQLTDLGISGLECIPTLEDLNLSHTNISYQVGECLSSFPALTKLSLSNCPHFHHMTLKSKTLTHLDLSFGAMNSVTPLTNCPRLKTLNLCSCKKLTDSGLKGLESISTLEEIDLSDTNIHDVSRLAGCRALRRLDLSKCSSLTASGVRNLELIPTLKSLNLQGSVFT